MVNPNTRQGKRTPVTLKIKFKSETLEQFIDRYAVDVSQGGIFIRTKEPLAVGTQMKFEFQLRDASPLIAGEGTVVWTRENDPSRPAIAPGMGVRFDRLADGSQAILERILAEKAKQAPHRAPAETTKPPLFTDTPTRVAPLQVQEQLLGGATNTTPRKRPDSYNEHTPLPKPTPWHSDADEFPEEAFEEQTKVRALDELIAQTAEGGTATTTMPSADELAARRGGRVDATLSDPVIPPPEPKPAAAPQVAAVEAAPAKPPEAPDEHDAAPVLPSPPETSRQSSARLLDTTPSPRTQAPTNPPRTKAAESSATEDFKAALTKPTGMRAVAADVDDDDDVARLPMARKSAAPAVMLFLAILAIGGGAVWFFIIRPRMTDDSAVKPPPGSDGSAVATPGSGSAGSAAMIDPVGSGSGVVEVGSGSAGSAGVTAPVGSGSAVAVVNAVDTEIGSSADKSTIEIVDTAFKGPAPLKAKLEKDKVYHARISAPGFLTKEFDVKGGQDKLIAKLEAKPHVITVSSDPPGALISIDGAATGHSTPFDVTLTKPQAAKKSVRVMLRKSGYKQVEKLVDGAAYSEDDTKLVTTVDERLTVQVQINTGGGNPVHTGGTATHTGSAAAGSNAGSDAASGSASTGTGPGSSAVTPPPTGTGDGPKDPGAGSATAVPPKDPVKDVPKDPKPAGSGSDPEPDWTKKP